MESTTSALRIKPVSQLGFADRDRAEIKILEPSVLTMVMPSRMNRETENLVSEIKENTEIEEAVIEPLVETAVEQSEYTKSPFSSENNDSFNRNYSKRLPFIEANTKEVSLSHLNNECVVPVFSKDNEITISHQAFIETIWNAVSTTFPSEQIEDPSIRVSHVIKGRTPDALHKSVKDLLDEDKTIYYERMMFAIEVPTIYEDMAGNRLNLTIGGVRAYNQENLYNKKIAEKFKVFIGFKNMVCCNLCICTDGYKADLRAMDTNGLYKSALDLFQSYNMAKHLYEMGALKEVSMNEHQFAQFLGKLRLYGFLPKAEQKKLPQMLMTDTQIGMVAKAYYHDDNFKVLENIKEINIWRVYNLLTGANKSSYIDNFLDRSRNATDLAFGLTRALHGESEYSWFLN